MFSDIHRVALRVKTVDRAGRYADSALACAAGCESFITGSVK